MQALAMTDSTTPKQCHVHTHNEFTASILALCRVQKVACQVLDTLLCVT